MQLQKQSAPFIQKEPSNIVNGSPPHSFGLSVLRGRNTKSVPWAFLEALISCTAISLQLLVDVRCSPCQLVRPAFPPKEVTASRLPWALGPAQHGEGDTASGLHSGRTELRVFAGRHLRNTSSRQSPPAALNWRLASEQDLLLPISLVFPTV